MAQRIKGQEVEILLVANSVPLTSITTIRSFEVALQNEILREGYLGETTERRDSIFKGVRGRFEMHLETPAFLSLFADIVNKSRRRTPGIQIVLKATLNFPNGARPRIQVFDCEFGELPLNFGSRSDYGTVTMEFEASEYAIIN